MHRVRRPFDVRAIAHRVGPAQAQLHALRQAEEEGRVLDQVGAAWRLHHLRRVLCPRDGVAARHADVLQRFDAAGGAGGFQRQRHRHHVVGQARGGRQARVQHHQQVQQLQRRFGLALVGPGLHRVATQADEGLDAAGARFQDFVGQRGRWHAGCAFAQAVYTQAALAEHGVRRVGLGPGLKSRQQHIGVGRGFTFARPAAAECVQA